MIKSHCTWLFPLEKLNDRKFWVNLSLYFINDFRCTQCFIKIYFYVLQKFPISYVFIPSILVLFSVPYQLLSCTLKKPLYLFVRVSFKPIIFLDAFLPGGGDFVTKGIDKTLKFEINILKVNHDHHRLRLPVKPKISLITSKPNSKIYPSTIFLFYSILFCH